VRHHLVIDPTTLKSPDHQRYTSEQLHALSTLHYMEAERIFQRGDRGTTAHPPHATDAQTAKPSSRPRESHHQK